MGLETLLSPDMGPASQNPLTPLHETYIVQEPIIFVRRRERSKERQFTKTNEHPSARSQSVGGRCSSPSRRRRRRTEELVSTLHRRQQSLSDLSASTTSSTHGAGTSGRDGRPGTSFSLPAGVPGYALNRNSELLTHRQTWYGMPSPATTTPCSPHTAPLTPDLWRHLDPLLRQTGTTCGWRAPVRTLVSHVNSEPIKVEVLRYMSCVLEQLVAVKKSLPDIRHVIWTSRARQPRKLDLDAWEAFMEGLALGIRDALDKSCRCAITVPLGVPISTLECASLLLRLMQELKLFQLHLITNICETQGTALLNILRSIVDSGSTDPSRLTLESMWESHGAFFQSLGVFRASTPVSHTFMYMHTAAHALSTCHAVLYALYGKYNNPVLKETCL